MHTAEDYQLLQAATCPVRIRGPQPKMLPTDTPPMHRCGLSCDCQVERGCHAMQPQAGFATSSEQWPTPGCLLLAKGKFCPYVEAFRSFWPRPHLLMVDEPAAHPRDLSVHEEWQCTQAYAHCCSPQPLCTGCLGSPQRVGAPDSARRCSQRKSWAGCRAG